MYSSATEPLEVLAIELMQLEPSLDRRANIVVPIDVFAKFTRTVATHDQKASVGIKVWVKEWFKGVFTIYLVGEGGGGWPQESNN